jgi:MAF protein
MGAAILDIDEPWKVKHRADCFLLAPHEMYELVGDVPNVVFPCAALADAESGRIAIYYGGADTVVAAGDKILGKPKDREDAFRMISGLRNQSHSVYTGVTLVYHGAQGDVISNFACETKVYVYDMTDEEIWSYIETGEPMDKAGAYGIQGRFAEYVSHIEGDYNNVVGLPLSALLQEAKKMEV